MSQIYTKFTRLMGIRTPLVCGNMAGASGGRLAAEVRKAGGYGFLSAGYDSAAKLQQEIDLARSILQVQPGSKLPLGVGYLAWQLEEPGAPAEELITLALENNVEAIWLAFGGRIQDWINLIRRKEKSTGATKIFVQISSLQEALVALNDWKADVIVAQGREAGGHGASQGLPLLTLVSQILPVLPKDGPPLLAAGGLANGSHLASYLALGVSGVVFGTRFLVAPESLYKDAQRELLIKSESESSVRTMAFDHARGTLGWPKGIDGRGIYNDTVKDFEDGVAEGVLRSKYQEASRETNTQRIVTWAGTGVGLITRSQSAKEIVEEVHCECVSSLQHATACLKEMTSQAPVGIENPTRLV